MQRIALFTALGMSLAANVVMAGTYNRLLRTSNAAIDKAHEEARQQLLVAIEHKEKAQECRTIALLCVSKYEECQDNLFVCEEGQRRYD